VSRFQVAQQTAADHRRAHQFTEVAFALAALAALVFVLLLHNTSLGAPFTPEARRVITWNFVGLTALDTMLLLVWQRLIARIAA
jgi:type VI protein secretion system component VasK